jgi:hypothetical protein
VHDQKMKLHLLKHHHRSLNKTFKQALEVRGCKDG